MERCGYEQLRCSPEKQQQFFQRRLQTGVNKLWPVACCQVYSSIFKKFVPALYVSTQVSVSIPDHSVNTRREDRLAEARELADLHLRARVLVGGVVLEQDDNPEAADPLFFAMSEQIDSSGYAVRYVAEYGSLALSQGRGTTTTRAGKGGVGAGGATNSILVVPGGGGSWLGLQAGTSSGSVVVPSRLAEWDEKIWPMVFHSGGSPNDPKGPRPVGILIPPAQHMREHVPSKEGLFTLVYQDGYYFQALVEHRVVDKTSTGGGGAAHSSVLRDTCYLGLFFRPCMPLPGSVRDADLPYLDFLGKAVGGKAPIRWFDGLNTKVQKEKRRNAWLKSQEKTHLNAYIAVAGDRALCESLLLPKERGDRGRGDHNQAVRGARERGRRADGGLAREDRDHRGRDGGGAPPADPLSGRGSAASRGGARNRARSPGDRRGRAAPPPPTEEDPPHPQKAPRLQDSDKPLAEGPPEDGDPPRRSGIQEDVMVDLRPDDSTRSPSTNTNVVHPQLQTQTTSTLNNTLTLTGTDGQPFQLRLPIATSSNNAASTTETFFESLRVLGSKEISDDSVFCLKNPDKAFPTGRPRLTAADFQAAVRRNFDRTEVKTWLGIPLRKLQLSNSDVANHDLRRNRFPQGTNASFSDKLSNKGDSLRTREEVALLLTEEEGGKAGAGKAAKAKQEVGQVGGEQQTVKQMVMVGGKDTSAAALEKSMGEASLIRDVLLSKGARLAVPDPKAALFTAAAREDHAGIGRAATAAAQERPAASTPLASAGGPARRRDKSPRGERGSNAPAKVAGTVGPGGGSAFAQPVVGGSAFHPPYPDDYSPLCIVNFGSIAGQSDFGTLAQLHVFAKTEIPYRFVGRAHFAEFTSGLYDPRLAGREMTRPIPKDESDELSASLNWVPGGRLSSRMREFGISTGADFLHVTLVAIADGLKNGATANAVLRGVSSTATSEKRIRKTPGRSKGRRSPGVVPVTPAAGASPGGLSLSSTTSPAGARTSATSSSSLGAAPGAGGSGPRSTTSPVLSYTRDEIVLALSGQLRLAWNMAGVAGESQHLLQALRTGNGPASVGGTVPPVRSWTPLESLLGGLTLEPGQTASNAPGPKKRRRRALLKKGIQQEGDAALPAIDPAVAAHSRAQEPGAGGAGIVDEAGGGEGSSDPRPDVSTISEDVLMSSSTSSALLETMLETEDTLRQANSARLDLQAWEEEFDLAQTFATTSWAKAGRAEVSGVVSPPTTSQQELHPTSKPPKLSLADLVELAIRPAQEETTMIAAPTDRISLLELLLIKPLLQLRVGAVQTLLKTVSEGGRDSLFRDPRILIHGLETDNKTGWRPVSYLTRALPKPAHVAGVTSSATGSGGTGSTMAPLDVLKNGQALFQGKEGGTTSKEGCCSARGNGKEVDSPEKNFRVRLTPVRRVDELALGFGGWITTRSPPAPPNGSTSTTGKQSAAPEPNRLGIVDVRGVLLTNVELVKHTTANGQAPPPKTGELVKHATANGQAPPPKTGARDPSESVRYVTTKGGSRGIVTTLPNAAKKNVDAFAAGLDASLGIASSVVESYSPNVAIYADAIGPGDLPTGRLAETFGDTAVMYLAKGDRLMVHRDLAKTFHSSAEVMAWLNFKRTKLHGLYRKTFETHAETGLEKSPEERAAEGEDSFGAGELAAAGGIARLRSKSRSARAGSQERFMEGGVRRGDRSMVGRYRCCRGWTPSFLPNKDSGHPVWRIRAGR